MALRLKLFWGLLMLSANEVGSQVLLTNETTGFEEGVFSRNAVDYFDPGEGGSNCIWDFSDLELSRTPHQVIQSVDSIGQMVVVDDRQITYYQMRGDSLLEIGNESPLKETYYYKPLCGMKYPLEYEDTIAKTFEGYGIYCGDHFFKETGVCNIVVDGHGDIVLSETDTLKNAVRVYKLKSYSIAMDIDPSKIDSAQLKQVIEEKYEWYVKGYSRPILETITSTSYDELSPLGTSRNAYCSLPESLFSDDEKQASDNNDNDEQDIPQDIIHYMVNVDGGSVDIEYSLDEKANITMLIASQTGMVYSYKKILQYAGTDYHVSFNVAGLRQGIYVLYINVNGRIYHETIRK